MINHITSTVFSPWARPKGMHGAMAHYQALYGLKPVGPHRNLADKLLSNITETCSTCGGTGLYGTYGGLGWRVCPTCHGLGVAYRISLDALQTLRQQVLAQYPDAGPENWMPGHPISCPIRALADGRIIDACPARDDDPVQKELFPTAAASADTMWVPWQMCVGVEPEPDPKPPAEPRPAEGSLSALARLIWRKLNTLV